MGLVSTLRRGIVLPKGDKQATQQVVKPEPQVDLRDAFIELVGERYGYYAARRLTQQEMTEKTEKERKAAAAIAKTIKDKIEEFIEKPTDETKAVILKNRKNLEEARKTLKTARQPFMEKITPLAKAVKYFDSVAIPDSLKELGHAVQPRFSLSDWVKDALKPKKK
jgi:gas vesicle protein